MRAQMVYYRKRLQRIDADVPCRCTPIEASVSIPADHSRSVAEAKGSLPMVFLPSRNTTPLDGFDVYDEPLSRGPRAIIDLLDVVDNVRDGDHLQCLIFLAQEFRLLAEPHFMFAARGPNSHTPHSLLLEGHFYALLREGIVDLDGAGRLRLRRDLFALPSSDLAGRRLAALGTLSPHETALFAATVMWLANQGRLASSPRHDTAFHDAVVHLGAGDAIQSVDVAAICDARRRLMPVPPVQLTSM